jgi:hypothetical protein
MVGGHDCPKGSVKRGLHVQSGVSSIRDLVKIDGKLIVYWVCLMD